MHSPSSLSSFLHTPSFKIQNPNCNHAPNQLLCRRKPLPALRMKYTLLKVFLILLIVLPTHILSAQTGCGDLPGDKYFGKTKITVKLDYLSNIPETDVPFDRWFYLQKKVPGDVRISDITLSDHGHRGESVLLPTLCFDQKPIKEDQGFDSVNILVPPLKPNSVYQLTFISNMDDERKQKFFDVFLNISGDKPDTTLNLYRIYGKEKTNLYFQPTIKQLKNYYDEHLKAKIAEYEAEKNDYSKELIKQEIFEIFEKSALTPVPAPKKAIFDASLIKKEMYIKRLTNVLIDYYLGNTEAAYLRFYGLHGNTGPGWGNFENFVKTELVPLLTTSDSTNLSAETFKSTSVLSTVKAKADGTDKSIPWEKLASYIDGGIAKYSSLPNVSSCHIWDKIKEDIHNNTVNQDTTMPWGVIEQYLKNNFSGYSDVGCAKYEGTVNIIHNLITVNPEIEVDEAVNLFKVASIEKLGVQNFDLKTRNSYRLVPDFGYVVYGFKPGTFFGGSPYVGVAYNLRSFDPDIPLKKIRNAMEYWQYLSFNIGVAFSSVAKTDHRGNLLRKSNLLTGIGVRVTQGLKVNLGTLWYNKFKGSQLTDHGRMSAALYLGLSLDFRLQELLSDLNGIFSGTFLPKKKTTRPKE